MSIIEMPQIITPSRSSFTILPSTQAQFNPYSQVEQIWDEAGDKWIVSLQWTLLPSADGRALRASLNALRGQVNILRVGDAAHSNIGAWPGTPRVFGAGQYGTILQVTDLGSNEFVAAIGDRFQLGNRMHELTASVVSDGLGQATLYFTPEIITPPSNNAALITQDIKGLFMLKDATHIPTFSRSRRFFRSVSLDLIEAIR